MDGGAWKAAVHGVAEGWTRLSDFTYTFHFHALEEEMATHSSVLAWRIPGTGEPSGLPSLGSHRVGHDWSDLAAAAAAVGMCSITQGAQLCALWWPRGVGWLRGGRLKKERLRPMAQQVKNPPANAGDTRDSDLIPGLGRPLEKEMVLYSSIISWKIAWTEEPGGL